MNVVGVRAFQVKRRATLARLKRVNRALACLEEVETAAVLGVRPRARRPVLNREALVSLRSMLEEVLVETEEAWELRN